MIEKYFSKHFSLLNKIDYKNERSINSFLLNSVKFYEKELLTFLPFSKKSIILDIGCGIGSVLNFLITRGYNDVYGIDISEEQLNVCNKYVTDKAAKWDVLDYLKQTTEIFDVIILYDVIEHIERDKILKLIDLLHKRLNRNGRVILRTPNLGSLLGSYSRYIDFSHTMGFTAESLHQVFSEFNFSEIKLFNSYIGKKRKVFLKALLKIFELGYNFKISEVITQNIILVAIK